MPGPVSDSYDGPEDGLPEVAAKAFYPHLTDDQYDTMAARIRGESPPKKPLDGLFRDQPDTPEGKYLVKRRDGTVPPWPKFVLGGADPIAIVALRAYAREARRLIREEPQDAREMGLTTAYADSISDEADRWEDYQDIHGKGDPGMGRHRVDDPATVAEMRLGRSA